MERAAQTCRITVAIANYEDNQHAVDESLRVLQLQHTKRKPALGLYCGTQKTIPGPKSASGKPDVPAMACRFPRITDWRPKEGFCLKLVLPARISGS
jgi:hypothetical protein